MNEEEAIREIRKLEVKPADQIATYDWVDRITELVIRLHANPDIEITTFQVHPSLPLVVEETMSDSAGFEIPIELLSFYRVTDGFDLKWHLKKSPFDFELGGEIKMLGFAEVFGSWIDSLWGVTPEGSDPDQLDFSWEIRALDLARATDPYCTVLHGPEDVEELDLYFHNPRGTSHRLGVRFSEYLESLILTGGTYDWQFLLCEHMHSPESEEELRAQRCAKALKHMFPEKDFSALELEDVLVRARYEEEE